ncbi:MAG TPA: Bax inhibitor-1/YccA family protein [Candidatus Dormibacteraeota bacterium]
MDNQPLPGQPAFAPGSLPLPAAAEAGVLSLGERVMGITCVGFLAAVAGVAAGAHGLNDAHTTTGRYLLWVLVDVALLLAVIALAEVPGLGLLAYVGFTFVTGIVLAPLIHSMSLNGQSAVVAQAFFATAGITLGLTLYARVTTRDFSGAGPYLFGALLGLVIMSFLQLFFYSPTTDLIIGAIGVVLFSFYLIYDIQRITRSLNTRGNAIRLALSLYLDILNVFVSLLRVLGSSR